MWQDYISTSVFSTHACLIGQSTAPIQAMVFFRSTTVSLARVDCLPTCYSERVQCTRSVINILNVVTAIQCNLAFIADAREVHHEGELIVTLLFLLSSIN